MIFLNFSQLSESVFPSNFLGKHFPENQAKIFLLLESVFHWPTFLMANKHKKVWKVISRKPLSGKQTQLKGKHFPENQVKNFFDWNWLESIFRWLESVFRWPTFLITNKHRKVWKMISRKLLSEKQTWPKKIRDYVSVKTTKKEN